MTEDQTEKKKTDTKEPTNVRTILRRTSVVNTEGENSETKSKRRTAKEEEEPNTKEESNEKEEKKTSDKTLDPKNKGYIS